MRLFSRVVIGPRIVPLAALFVGLGPLSTDVNLPLLPQVARTFSATDATAELTITGAFLGLAVGQLIAGPLSDQRGRRTVLLTGLVLFSVTTGVSALAPSIGVLILIRFLAGVCAAFSFVVARAMVADALHETELARGYALMGAIFALTPVAAPVIGGVLSFWLGWHGVFIMLAGIGLLLWAIAYLKVPETLGVHQRSASGFRQAASDLGGLLRQSRFMAYVLMIGCTGGMLFSYIASSPFILEDRFGFSPGAFSAVFALNALGMFVAAVLGRRVVRRCGPDRLLWWGQGAAFVGSGLTLAGLAFGILPLVLMGFGLAVAMHTWITTNSMALGIELAPSARGSASALLGIAGFAVGGALGYVSGMGGVMLGVMMVVFTGLGLVIHATLAPRPLRPAGL
jgi:DHA1 family bicyclomycin/chloramphenicol resistance-like MFS transporter